MTLRLTLLIGVLAVAVACDDGEPAAATTSADGTATPPTTGQSCSLDEECPSGQICVQSGKADRFDDCLTVCLDDCVFFEPPGTDCPALCDAACSSPGIPLPDGGSAAPDAGSGTPGTSVDPPPAGVCQPASAPGPGPGPTPEPDAGPTPAPVSWAGIWSVRVAYTARCDLGFGNVKTADHDHSVSLQLQGANDGLTASTGNHQLTGFGNATQLALNGTFPVLSSGGDEASIVAKDTKISLALDDVESANHASGTVSGTYTAAGFSGDCSVVNGTATFMR